MGNLRQTPTAGHGCYPAVGVLTALLNYNNLIPNLRTRYRARKEQYPPKPNTNFNSNALR